MQADWAAPGLLVGSSRWSFFTSRFRGGLITTAKGDSLRR